MKDATLGGFIRRAAVVGSMCLVVFGVAKVLDRWMPWTVRSDMDSADAALVKRMDGLEDKLERTLTVVELQAVVTIEAPGSPEQLRALAQLREMRRLVPPK